ncbi:ribonuclease R [Eubacteriales bacterium OttesenSCG-928-N14]|nr:ribonuclease R [Eubacteriales bacterium OttesenSCG-928-N14]
MEQAQLQSQLLQLIQNQKTPVDIAELSVWLEQPQEAIEAALRPLEAAGQIMRTKRGKIGLPQLLGYVAGKLSGNARGFAFLVPYTAVNGNREGDIFIPPGALNGAMHGDEVLVHITGRAHRGQFNRQQGEVVRMLKRARSQIIGRFERNGKSGYVIPDDRRITPDIRIPRDGILGATTGDLVQVEITSYGGSNRPPTGRVMEVLGKAGSPVTDVIGIIRHYGLHERFPEKIAALAEKIPPHVREKEMRGRLDLRHDYTITIDGADAKDLDDAITLYVDAAGYHLGVHIADVSHYVKPGDAIDAQAYDRGTSVYFPGMVLPMLPTQLSNGICSLNAGEDRLALSCLMDIGNDGQIQQFRFVSSVIHVDRRMTYEHCNAMLERNDATLIEEYQDVYPLLGQMQQLAALLMQRRRQKGSIDFDLQESEIVLNAAGEVVHVGVHERGISNAIIEEFMLSANQCAAIFGQQNDLPFLYRVHENPDEGRMEELYDLLHALGISAKRPTDGVQPRDLAAVLQSVQGSEYAEIVSMVMLRSMKKARYTDTPIGHFGLAMKDYCHFTSPIRRYPDLVVHRSIKAALADGQPDGYLEKLELTVHAMGDACSEAERNAMEAERAVDDLLIAQYMANHIGEEYEGIISGVTDFGLFVRLPNTVEGLIRIAELDDDYYIYDEKLYRLTGKNTGTVYALGDGVQIRVTGVNLDLRRAEFELLGRETTGPKRRSKRQGKRPNRR